MLLNGKVALSVPLPLVQEVHRRLAVQLDDDMVAYDDHFLREPFIRLNELIANDRRLPVIVRSELVQVETSRTNWVSARRELVCAS